MTKNFFLNFFGLLIFISSIFGLFYKEISAAPAEITKVLVSEIKPSGGSGKTTDEYIELYNPNDLAADLSGWTLFRQTKLASSTDRDMVINFPQGTLLSSHMYLLVAHNDYTGTATPDFIYGGTSITDDNTIILTDNSGLIVDLVGYGKAVNVEKEAAVAPTTQFLSLERLPGGLGGNVQDTDNNALDFVRALPTPQNRLSNLATTTDIVTSDTISSLATTSTTSTDVTPTKLLENEAEAEVEAEEISLEDEAGAIVGSVLINEFLPHPLSEQVEFVELYNRTDFPIELSGWWIEDGGGSKTPLNNTIASYGYLVIEKPKGNLNNSGDVVKLISFDKTVVDEVVFGDWDDESSGNNAPEPLAGLGLARRFGNADTDDHRVDFFLTNNITPGNKNNIEIPIINNDETTINSSSSVVNAVPTNTVSVKSEKEIIKKTASPLKIEPLRVKVLTEKSVDFGEPIIFDAGDTTGNGAIYYAWEMGDGVVLTGAVIDYVYQTPGIFVVTLSVSDTSTARMKKFKVTVKEKKETQVVKVVGSKKIETKKTEIKKDEPNPIFITIEKLSELKNGTPVSITGIVVAEPESYKKKEFYVVDEAKLGSGVRVVYKKEAPPVMRGDKVTVTGEYTIKEAEVFVALSRTDFVVVLRHDVVPTPQAEKITALGNLAGGFIKVSGEVSDAKKDYVYLDDSTGEIRINGLKKQKLAVRDTAEVSGILLKSKDGMELYPRAAEDIIVYPTTSKNLVEKIKDTPLKPASNNFSPHFFWLLFGLPIGYFFIKNKKIPRPEVE